MNYLIDAYTLQARINTLCKGITIHDYDKVKDKGYVERYMQKYNNWQKCFEIYFGSCKPFRIEHSIMVYEKFKPKSVFDPCCGWGGRAIAASMLSIPYVGMDTNPELIKPYELICKDWDVTFKFGDCLKAEWFGDMIFTSPPYFNREVYVGSSVLSKKEWSEWYRAFALKCKKFPIICLNVPAKVYSILVSVLGECSEKILLPIRKRLGYEEFIYIWSSLTADHP